MKKLKAAGGEVVEGAEITKEAEAADEDEEEEGGEGEESAEGEKKAQAAEEEEDEAEEGGKVADKVEQPKFTQFDASLLLNPEAAKALSRDDMNAYKLNDYDLIAFINDYTKKGFETNPYEATQFSKLARLNESTPFPILIVSAQMKAKARLTGALGKNGLKEKNLDLYGDVEVPTPRYPRRQVPSSWWPWT